MKVPRTVFLLSAKGDYVIAPNHSKIWITGGLMAGLVHHPFQELKFVFDHTTAPVVLLSNPQSLSLSQVGDTHSLSNDAVEEGDEGESDANPGFFAEEIIEHTDRNGKRKCEVRWLGCGDDTNLEPADRFVNDLPSNLLE